MMHRGFMREAEKSELASLRDGVGNLAVECAQFGVGLCRGLLHARQRADEDHRALIVAHTGDAKDLEERLRYVAYPEQAWWAQPADDDLEAFFARVIAT